MIAVHSSAQLVPAGSERCEACGRRMAGPTRSTEGEAPTQHPESGFQSAFEAPQNSEFQSAVPFFLCSPESNMAGAEQALHLRSFLGRLLKWRHARHVQRLVRSWQTSHASHWHGGKRSKPRFKPRSLLFFVKSDLPLSLSPPSPPPHLLIVQQCFALCHPLKLTFPITSGSPKQSRKSSCSTVWA